MRKGQVSGGRRRNFSEKSLFRKKKLPTERKFEKCCKAKRCTRAVLVGKENISTRKNENENVLFLSKKLLKSHFWDPQKDIFFNFAC